MANSWFCYTGAVPSQPSSYTRITREPFCAGSTYLCAIYALVNATGKPVITTTLLAAISQAIDGVPSTNVLDCDREGDTCEC